MAAWKLTGNLQIRHVLTLGVPYWHDPLRPFLFCAPDITPGVIPVRDIQRAIGRDCDSRWN